MKSMKSKTAGKLAAAALGIYLIGSPAYAQQNSDLKKSLVGDAVAANSGEENHLFRAEGYLMKGPRSLIGFIDNYGKRSKNYYTEVYARQDFAKRAGLQAELNDGSSVPMAFRAGAIFDVPSLPKNVYANVKVLPLNVGRNGAMQELQISTFASAELPKGFHVEHWADFNLWNTQAPRVIMEGTATKTIKGKWSAVARVSYKVNTEGLGFRAGIRYKIF